MTKSIEQALIHWGEQYRFAGMGGALPSPSGALLEFGGRRPGASAFGSRCLVMGKGMDGLACEVDAALAAIEARQAEGRLLATVARGRYLPAPAWPVDEQLDRLGLPVTDAGRRQYRRLVQRLHKAVEAELLERAQARGAA